MIDWIVGEKYKCDNGHIRECVYIGDTEVILKGPCGSLYMQFTSGKPVNSPSDANVVERTVAPRIHYRIRNITGNYFESTTFTNRAYAVRDMEWLRNTTSAYEIIKFVEELS